MRRRRHGRALGRPGPPGQVRRADERRRRPPDRGRRRAREAPPRRGAGGRAPARHRRVRGARQPRRRADADARGAPAGHPAHPPVEGRHGARAAPQRLPPRPPLHRRRWCRTRATWSWCRTSARTRRRCGRTRSSSTSQDGFQRPNPFRPDVAVVDRRRDRQEDRARSTRHVSQIYEWLPWVDGNLDRCPRSRRRGSRGCGAARSGKPIADDVRAALRKWYGAEGRRREGRRGLRGLRVRPRGRARPTCAGCSRSSTAPPGGPGGAAEERPPESVEKGVRLESCIVPRLGAAPPRAARRRRAGRRLDARTARAARPRPLAIVYTDTADFTVRVASTACCIS